MSTIAEELVLLNNTKHDIASAIEEKHGVVPFTFAEYGDAIRNIPQKEALNNFNPVKFIDFNGDLVASYTVDEAMNLSSLPELPARYGMMSQGWNYTLEEMKAHLSYFGECIVGCNYITDDGITYLDIEIDTSKFSTFPLKFGQTAANGVTIDWGDGTTEQSASSTKSTSYSHTYAGPFPATYQIKIIPGSGLPKFEDNICGFSNSNNTNPAQAVCSMVKEVKFGSIGSGTFKNTLQYFNLLYEVNIPNSITQLNGATFSGISQIKAIVIPRSVTNISSGNTFSYNNTIKFISLPETITSFNEYKQFYFSSTLQNNPYVNSMVSFSEGASSTFESVRGLKQIIWPVGYVTTIGTSAFKDCSSLRKISVPESVSIIGNYAFSGCNCIVEMQFLGNITSIGTGAFSGCPGIMIFDFSNNTSVPILANVSAFTNTPSSKKIIVPDALYDDWISASNWSSTTNNIVTSIVKESEA